MTNSLRERNIQPTSLWHAFRVLETPMMWFILANILDFVVTWRLLVIPSRASFVESNPIARYYLEGWGPFRGLLMLKLTVTGVVCVIALIVGLRRIRTARRLLQFGALVVGGVAAYSAALFFRHQ